MIAVPVYQERVSPLLDVAKKFAVYEIIAGEIKQKIIADIHSDDEAERFGKLKEIGVSLIIGGAVSSFISELINTKGIRLVSWISGPVDDIIELYLKDELKSVQGKNFTCRRGRKRRGCKTDNYKYI